MINYYRKTIKDKEVSQLNQFRIGCWVSVINPTDFELEQIIKKFNLKKEKITVLDDENLLPDFEIIGSKLYIYLKCLDIKRKIINLIIVINPKFLITISNEKPIFFDNLLKDSDFYTTQKLKSLIKIFIYINNYFQQEESMIIREVKDVINSVEKISNIEIEILSDKENYLNFLYLIYRYMILTYKKLLRRLKFFEEDRKIIMDLIEELQESYDLCEVIIKNIATTRSHTQLLFSNRLNNLIINLTVLTVLLSVPMAITGFYGMNVALPLQNHPLIFYYILLISIFTGVILLYILKKKL